MRRLGLQHWSPSKLPPKGSGSLSVIARRRSSEKESEVVERMKGQLIPSKALSSVVCTSLRRPEGAPYLRHHLVS